MLLRTKKGVSVMIGYVLLITIAVVMGSFVYVWVKNYVPYGELECDDGVSLMITDTEYDCADNLVVSLKNNGKFSVAGFFIHATNDATKELATIDLSANLSTEGMINSNGVAYFDPTAYNSLTPGRVTRVTFDLTTYEGDQLQMIEIIPARFQTEDNREEFVSCGSARVNEELVCS